MLYRIDYISSDNDNLSVADLDNFQTDPFAGFDDFEEYRITNNYYNVRANKQ